MSLSDFINILYPTLLICGLVTAIILISVVLTVLFLDRHLRACPECHRRGTGYIVDTETLESNTHIDYRGGQAARVTKEHLVDHYECEHCGHQWTRTIRRTERTPHKRLKGHK